jgi:hypothetical protein
LACVQSERFRHWLREGEVDVSDVPFAPKHDGVELHDGLIADDAANTALPGILFVHGGADSTTMRAHRRGAMPHWDT